MEEERPQDFGQVPAPLTEDQIIAANVGPLRPLNSTIYLAPPDPAWPSQSLRLKEQIQQALGDDILLLEHVGSTSIPGLAAKPIIDMVLAMTDSSNEPAYVRPLEQKGYTLAIREPDWYEHRLLKPAEVPGNLHVFSELSITHIFLSGYFMVDCALIALAPQPSPCRFLPVFRP